MKIKNIILGLSFMLAITGINELHVKADSCLSFWEEINNQKSDTWDWAENAIHWAHAEGITVGSGEGDFKHFNPDKKITRAEAVTMITKFQEFDISAYDVNSTVFYDANAAWYTPYVNAAYENRLIAGKSEGRFDPNGLLTRAEAATILVNAMGYTIEKNLDTGFQDISDEWYTDYVATAYANGLVSGKSESRFDPQTGITRAEMVMILYKAAMTKNTEGKIYAVLLDNNESGFSLMSNGETLFTYNAATDTINGDVKVKEQGNYKMVYFTQCDSLEIIPERDETVNYLRFFSQFNDFDIYLTGDNWEKVTIEPDKSVILTCLDKEQSITPKFYLIGLWEYSIENMEGEKVIYDEDLGNYYGTHYSVTDHGTTIKILNDPSKFYKITPINKDTSFKIIGCFQNVYYEDDTEDIN